MSGVHTFPKSERLCSRKAIEALFASGNRSFSAFPLRAVYRQDSASQVMFTVSKRHFKHAVDRNRIKRQLREAWRQHRDILSAELPPLHIAFLWLSDDHFPSDLIHRKMKNLLHRITEECSAVSSSSPSASTSASSRR